MSAPEVAEQAQLLSQLEQLFAELEALRGENARLREQLEATTTSQKDLIERMRMENTQLREQLEAVATPQETPQTMPRARADEDTAPANETRSTESSGLQGRSGQAGAEQDDQSPQLQKELSELQRQVQIINDEHAALLEQLDSATAEMESPKTKEQRTHVVQAGDSLSRLADLYYGTGSRWPEILAANPSVTDPDRLITGTVLVVP